MTAPPTAPVRAYDPTLRLIGRTGQFLLTYTIILFVFLGLMWPDPYKNVWQLVLAHLVGGRPLNVLRGLDLGFHPLFIYLQCCIEDIIILCLFYPFLVAGYRRAVEWRVLGSALVSIRETAARHKSKIEPYGVAGLMIFVIFPFWSTGALVGAVVGYLLGMRTWVAFTAVLTGNFIAAALWVWLFDRINELSSHLTKGLLVAILVGVLITAVGAQVRSLRKQRKAMGMPQDAIRMKDASSSEGPPASDDHGDE